MDLYAHAKKMPHLMMEAGCEKVYTGQKLITLWTGGLGEKGKKKRGGQTGGFFTGCNRFLKAEVGTGGHVNNSRLFPGQGGKTQKKKKKTDCWPRCAVR